LRPSNYYARRFAFLLVFLLAVSSQTALARGGSHTEAPRHLTAAFYPLSPPLQALFAPSVRHTPEVRDTIQSAQAAAVPVPSPPRFIWPTSGPVTNPFGSEHPKGIDIGLAHDPNGDVFASRAGTVAVAGGTACCEYGLYVTIDHGDGYKTLYAHLSRILVSEGQEVGQGELLGYGGATGRSRGFHLHFELIKDGELVGGYIKDGEYIDPVPHLPPALEPSD
jgi:murein DD-endopeptidase MepM/ murein hydrolase activator NlpD